MDTWVAHRQDVDRCGNQKSTRSSGANTYFCSPSLHCLLEHTSVSFRARERVLNGSDPTSDGGWLGFLLHTNPCIFRSYAPGSSMWPPPRWEVMHSMLIKEMSQIQYCEGKSDSDGRLVPHQNDNVEPQDVYLSHGFFCLLKNFSVLCLLPMFFPQTLTIKFLLTCLGGRGAEVVKNF